MLYMVEFVINVNDCHHKVTPVLNLDLLYDCELDEVYRANGKPCQHFPRTMRVRLQ